MSDRRSPETIARWATESLDTDVLHRLRVPLGLVAVIVFIRPVVSHPVLLGYEQIANSILIWMLFAASFNLLIGYTGLLSFGHAMFLGFGTYGAAIGVLHMGLPFIVAALISVAVATVVAHLIGRLTVQKGDILRNAHTRVRTVRLLHCEPELRRNHWREHWTQRRASGVD